MEESSGDESISSINNINIFELIQKLFNIVKNCSVDEFSQNLTDSSGKEHSYVSNILSTYFDSHNTSIFYTAIENGNIKVADYLTSTYPYLIQNLPFEHQISISTKILEAQELNLFYDLLAFYDFPYPKDFKIDSVQDERIQQICSERLLFHKAITDNNEQTINDFIDKNRNLKYIFDLNNKSALSHAREIKNFKILYHLRSNGFQAIDDPFDFSDLSDKEFKNAKEAASNQTNINIERSCSNDESPILFLTSRSLIYNIRDSRNNQKKYRKLIQKWYEEINKIKFGNELLSAASQCDSLKVVFDFQSESVEQVDMRSFSNCAGVTYPIRKLIIIGSKISKENTEQHIKGVLAHELCHYALMLVYENNENPNYKNDNKAHKIMKTIIHKVKSLVFDLAQKDFKDDECNGIISSVYQSYKSQEHPQELIVRPVHIFAVFDNDEIKSKQLETKYESLFKFFEDHVLPEFKNFDLKYRMKIRDINKKSGIILKIRTQEYEFSKPIKNLINLIDRKGLTISTNVPQILIADIYKYLGSNNLIDVSNIFINSQSLKDSQIYNSLKELKSSSFIRVFINSSEHKLSSRQMQELSKNDSLRIIIICSNDKVKTSKDVHNVEYKFCDLTNQNKLQLLKKNVKFQNVNIKLLDLLSPAIKILKKEKDQELPNEVESLIDDELFKTLIEGGQININQQHFCDPNESLFQPRNFSFRSQNKLNKKLTQNELIEINETEKFVQIIGKPKSGKSWTLQNLGSTFLSKFSKMWICHLDLQLFENLLDFSQVGIYYFLSEKVLNFQKQFEKNIFENLYKNGKVILLIDDVNDPVPSQRSFIKSLIDSFEYNGGNRLWITSRNIFPNFNNVYEIEGLSLNDGIDLILSILNNQSTLKNIQIESDHLDEKLVPYKRNESKVKISKDFCHNLEKMINLWNVPLFFKMIADYIYTTNDIQPKIFKILSKHVNNICKKSIQQTRMGTELELKKYFSNLAKRSFGKEIYENYYEKNNIDFIVHELVYKENGNIFFLHEIFRDYFIVEFLIAKLSDEKISLKFSNVLSQILFNSEHKGVRYLFDNALSDATIFKEIMNKQGYFECDFISQNKLTNILKIIFEENLEYVSEFLTVLCNETSSNIILKCLIDIEVINVHSLRILGKIIGIFDRSFIEIFIRNKKIFHELIEYDIPIEEVIEFAIILDEMRLTDVVREELRSEHEDTGETLLHLACKYPHKLEGTFKLLKTFQTKSELSDLFQAIDYYDNTFLHTFVGIKNNQYIESNTTSTSLVLAGTHNIYLEFLLNEMLAIYKNNEFKMKNLILIKNFQEKTFLHAYIIENKSNEIKMLFKILEKEFDKNDYLDIVYARHFKKRNLLQIAAYESNDILIQKTMWTIFIESFQSKTDFINFLKNKDEDGNNILHLVTCYGAINIFNHIILELETLFPNESTELIRNLFESVDNSQNNLLSLMAKKNKNWEFHENVWSTMKRYFTNAEIWKLINHADLDGNNFFGNAIKFNELCVVTKGWIQIKQIIETQNLINQRKYLEESVKNGLPDVEDVKTFVESILCQLKVETNDLEVKSKERSYFPKIGAIAVLTVIIAIIFFNYYNNNASFNESSDIDRLKIQNTTVIYKKTNVKFDDLVRNSLIAYNKLSKDHIKRFLSGEEVNLDDPIFFDVTNVIHHKWENIDNNLKKKILNSNFLFQNEILKYEFFHSSFPKFFEKLTSDQILSILNDNLLKIGKMLQEIKPPNLQNVEIKQSNLFLQNFKLTKNDYKIVGNFDVEKGMTEEFKEKKFFILKQEVLDEKLTSFRLDTIIKLKKQLPKYWIVFIDLREHINFFNQNKKKTNIVELLIDFLKLENDYEKNFFQLSYEANQIILMWDAYDEVISVNRDIVNNFMELIYYKSSNIQFVSVQMSYDSLEDDDQESIRRSLVIYKNVKLKLSELFHNNIEGYNALSSTHILQMLKYVVLDLKDPQFKYFDKFINFNWENLNGNLKEKILNMDLILQNEKVTFKSLDQLYPNIFMSLTSEQICNILDDIPLQIGKMINNPIDTNIINERIKNLEESNSNEQICSNKTLFSNIEDYEFLSDGFHLVSNDNLHEFITTDGNQNPRFFILTLDTTIEVLKGFDKNSIQNIKKKFPTRLIIYVNFPQFEKNIKNHGNLQNLEYLNEIFDVSLSDEIGKKIFELSYKSGNIIFIWDGIYEIKKENNTDLLKLMTMIHQESTNIQFISSKSLCPSLNIEYEESNFSFLAWLYLKICNFFLYFFKTTT